jgi:HD-like signal output (HDOD) protein
MESPSASKRPDTATCGLLDNLLDGHFADLKLELPLLPTYATQVVALCSNPDSDARSLAQLLQLDPALAAHVLSIANSAAMGAREPIVSLQQAIARLGARTLANVALSVAVRTKIFSAGRHLERVRALWRHSALTAEWGREIARLRRQNVESAFLCGLLHEVGAPVVLQAIDDLQLRTPLEFTPEQVDAAVERLHCELGERLVRAWNLPEWTSVCARYHHSPDAAVECRDEAFTVNLALQLASHSGGELELCTLDPILAALGLYHEDLEDLLEKTESIRAMAEVLT